MTTLEPRWAYEHSGVERTAARQGQLKLPKQWFHWLYRTGLYSYGRYNKCRPLCTIRAVDLCEELLTNGIKILNVTHFNAAIHTNNLTVGRCVILLNVTFQRHSLNLSDLLSKQLQLT